MEGLEISSVYLAPPVNKDDLSSNVRDNRTANETLTQKQMFSEIQDNPKSTESKLRRGKICLNVVSQLGKRVGLKKRLTKL